MTMVSLATSLLLARPAQCAGASANLQLKENPAGELSLDARGAPIGQALEAVGAKAGFEVLVSDARSRPPLSLNLSEAPVEAVLQEMLRGRNYALIYDADDGELSRVILLPPSTTGPSRVVRQPVQRVQRNQRGKAAPAPLVIRN